MIPTPWAFVLLALAAQRSYWLIGEDAITEPLRALVTNNGERERTHWFLTCPWCSGAWISLAWWTAWWYLDEWAVAVAVPFALSAVVGAVTMVLHSLADD